MLKVFSGLVLGLAAGAALSVSGVLPTIAQQNIADNSVDIESAEGLDASSSEIAKTLRQENESLKKTQEKHGKAISDLVDSHQAEVALLMKQVKAYKDKESEAAELAAESNRLSIEEEKKATAKALAKSQELIGNISNAILTKDKKAIIKYMKEFKELDKVAYPAFFEAWEQISNAHDNEDLKVADLEFFNMLNKDLVNYVLDSNNTNVPNSARKWSVFHVITDTNREEESKVSTLMKLAEETNDDEITGMIIDLMAQMGQTAGVEYISKIMADTTRSTSLRVKAIESMMKYGEDADWEAIFALEGDSDPQIVQQVQFARVSFDPPATGIFINYVGDATAAKEAGFAVGDILISYNGDKVRDLNALGSAKQKVGNESKVNCEVMREGTILMLTIRVGQMGINGQGVTKK